MEISFKADTIRKAIKDIANNTAPGPVQFPVIFLKNCAEELSVPLDILYCSSSDSGIIPRQLKTGKKLHQFKKGDREKIEVIINSLL